MNTNRAAVFVFSGQVFNSIVTLGAYIYFANSMSAGAFGTFFLFQAVLMMVSIPTSIGQGGALIKRLSEGDTQETFFGTSFGFLIVASLAGMLGLLAFHPYLNSYFSMNITPWLVVGLPLLHLRNLVLCTLKGELRVDETPLITISEKIIWVGLGILLVHQGWSSKGLILAYLSGLTGAFYIGYLRISISMARPTLDAAKSLFHYWKWSAVSFVDSFLYNWTDILIIGFFVTQAAVGAYEIAWRVAGFAILFSKAIETAILPKISSLSTQGHIDEVETEVQKALILSLWLVVPIATGSVFVGKELLSLVFGTEYGQAAVVLSILLFGKIIEAVDSVYKNLLSGIDRPDLRMKAAVPSAVMNVIFNIWFIQFLGIVGTAIATTLSFALSTVIIVYFTRKIVSIQFPWRATAGLLLATGTMSAMIYGLQAEFPSTTPLSLGATIVIGAGVYFGVCAALPRTRHVFLTLINSLSVQSDPEN